MKEPQVKLSRRPLLVGAGVVGALAAAATVVKKPSDPPPVDAASTKPAPAQGGGYRESEHVRRYYQTTRI